MHWRRRIVGSAAAIALMLFAISLFGGAIAISRINSLIAKSDARLEAGDIGGWRSFLKYPVNPWIVERLGHGDALELRRIYVSFEDGELQDAEVRLQKFADSRDSETASLALTLLGKIHVFRALSNKDGEMLEQARRMFGRAVVLNEDNEDAKHNLELLSTLRRMSGDQPGENGSSEDAVSEDNDEGLPLDTLPGGEGGEPDKYSGY